MDTPALLATTHASIDAIGAEGWNALEHDGVPFLRHEFLAALEHSGAVGPGTGWQPCHVAVRSGATLVGALPLYRKTHSWGEFVFDFSWAQAYSRHGSHYYPKLVAATPFTPAAGPRLLVRPGAESARVRRALLDAALESAPEASSLHVQFATGEEAGWLEREGLLARLDCQFHWHNQGFADFEGFLAAFTAEKRKKARRERRRVLEAGVCFEMRAGAELSSAEWQRVHALHADTFRRHGHDPYLNQAFFTEISVRLPGQPQVLLAHHQGEIIATAIFFRGRDTLYGRYWGAAGDYHSLHFESCYHQGIEYCIREGLASFEPGTQGEHKLARGFTPTLTHSAHLIRDPRFAHAIGRFLVDERAAVRAYAQDAAAHAPYRAGTAPSDVPPSAP
ncbi:MAG TPA: GNAT family N-acetyltransferase [Steroidobacteraceae bacterium]|nr:GNAT family N-acetyltransferase [Steroidobacteraceae bacterium]